MEIIEIENRKTIDRISETESRFFEKINKTDKPLARLTRKIREKTQITKIINESGIITVDLAETERIIREYWEQLYANKLDNLYEMDRFLVAHKLPKLTSE